MKKGLRVLLCLFFSIFLIIICISFNLKDTKEHLGEKGLSVIGCNVEPNIDLVVKDSVNIEINTKLPTIKDYFDNYDLNDKGVIKYYLSDKEVNSKYVISNKNTYDVVIIINNNKYNSKLNIVDTKAPILKLKNITIYEGQSYNINSFIDSCKDNSNRDCILNYTSNKMNKYTKVGTYKISISANDNSNNKSLASAKLTIKARSNSNKQSNKGAKDNVKNINNTSNSKYKTSNELKSIAKDEVKKNKNISNEIINYTNGYRSKAGVNNLSYDEDLSTVATIRAIEIAIYDKFDHVRPNGETFSSVIRELNIDYEYCGENIAYGYINSKEVSEAWKASRGHYMNMIGSEYNKIGIGYYEYNNIKYWVQIFTN